mgnify:CR=1 FL=1
MKRIIIFLLVTITNIIVSHAQTTICGTVVSDNDDQPIIGASITIDGQNQGALSDMDGKFKITVPAGKKIIVNYIGMKKITCTPQNNMPIRLSSKSSKVTSASKNKSGSLSAEKKIKNLQSAIQHKIPTLIHIRQLLPKIKRLAKQ